MIRAVLFDAGATLVHPDPPVEAIYAREFATDGVRFTDGGLRDTALTHRSYAFERGQSVTNERLEFLGDSVLELFPSSASTVSPTSLNHLVMVPSVTVSPTGRPNCTMTACWPSSTV